MTAQQIEKCHVGKPDAVKIARLVWRAGRKRRPEKVPRAALPNFYKMDMTRCVDTIQELLGNKDVKTTIIYTHVLQRGGMAVIIPLDG